ncbi:MAG: nicotinate-nucleotide adenylyltransferase [Clostridia bacterium]|nr:nicotinate-nucleotide adenylyltransferase [Clostridia bacterium]
MQHTASCTVTGTVQARLRRIGILGGTFNPVHCGHIEMARAALHECGLDEVWLMPSKNPPHKPLPHLAGEQDRLAMVALACETETGLYPSTVEIDRPGVTYTVDTLRQLSEQPAEYCFIIGSDTVFQLETWREFEAVLAMICFVVFIRGGEDSAPVLEKIAFLKARYGAQFHVCQTECPDISSTEVRRLYQAGSSLAQTMVPAAVAAYIRERGLYRECQ